MRELVHYIADWLVEDPDAVRIDERRRGDRVIVQLHVAQEDMGRVIGREGRVATAMRTVLKASGSIRERDDVPHAHKDLIFGPNAMRFYGLKPEDVHFSKPTQTAQG